MPRPASHPQDFSLQGSLFSDPEPTATIPTEKESKSGPFDLSEKDLKNDGAARPRQRKSSEKTGITISEATTDELAKISDDPPWSHHSQPKPELLTPVLRHYVELKHAHPQRVLLYRIGDFFECFFEDAITLSRKLDLTLTGKEGGKTIGRVPMAGIPHHAAVRYCSELIRLGYSVALCDQLETTPVKGALLKRDITRVLTPGTVLEEGILSARHNNWLAAVVIEPANKQQPFRWGIAQADVSTGDVKVMQREGSEELLQQLAQLEASELLWSGDDPSPPWCPDRFALTPMSRTHFSRPEAEAALLLHYNLACLDGLGLLDLPLALRAIGGLLRYVSDTQPLEHNTCVRLEVPEIVHSGGTLVLDAQTRRNLELTATQRDGALHGSLLWAIDRTLTAMGGRCLRRWIEEPLTDRESIRQRQDLVSVLVEERQLRLAVRRLLRSMGDLERLAGRAGTGHAGGRDLIAIADGLERLPKLASRLGTSISQGPPWLKTLLEPKPQLQNISKSVRHTLVNSPPLSLSEGGLIHDGIDGLLDGLRNQLDDQYAWLKEQERRERQLSGITNLRLQHHRTFGYYITVSKAKADSVPNHWIRRQTLANEERFTTPELKKRESHISQLHTRAFLREYELFIQLREQVGMMAAEIREAGRAVSALDSITGLADVAATENFCPPVLTNNRELALIAARHPVVEQLLVETTFTPNDVSLGSGIDLVVLTGPNASGKSCYLRQIGLIQLMAQIGSWVPAQSATIGIADRIFTRVGAVDDLAAGQSTFIVEMAETANILNHATSSSLVLLDEIGRGTATFDGLSIAWAVSEHLAGVLQSRSIFATHYHELNTLARTNGNVANFQVMVKETGKDLLFLHKVSPGGASRSYGIEAARLAGVPVAVVQRARQVLNQLEAEG